MKLSLRLSTGVWPALLLAPLALAQSYPAKRVVFKNPGVASQAQLEATTGLHAGSRFTRDDLAAAAQKISDTGFYDNVAVTTTGPADALTVEFTLTPSDPAGFVPTGFENFVWLSGEEIRNAIQAKIPLYNGTLPEAGPQADTAAAALVEALTAKHVDVMVNAVGAIPVGFKVEHETFEPTLAHPLRVMEFRLASPAPVVANVKLQGVTPELVPLLQKSVNRTAHTLYNEGRGGVITQELILGPLLDAGYAMAVLSHMTMEIGAPAEGKVPLVLTTTLTPGRIFKLSTITFAGTPFISADDFAKAAKLHPGDPDSRALLMQTLEPIDAAYRSQGYMDVIVKADPDFDPQAATVAYTISVDPGQQYRLKDITTDGLDPAAKADFDKYFKLHSGDIFNAVYVNGFIKNNTALASLSRYTGGWKAYAHPESHTVDLDIRFFPGSGRVSPTTVVVH